MFELKWNVYATVLFCNDHKSLFKDLLPTHQHFKDILLYRLSIKGVLTTNNSVTFKMVASENLNH